MASSRIYRAVRIGSAVLLVGAAIHHIGQAVAGNGDVLRHWAFAPINLAVAALLAWRPRWAYYPTLVLCIQQMWSHGLDLSRSFVGSAPLDKTALAVCLFFPMLVTILYLERQEHVLNAA